MEFDWTQQSAGAVTLVSVRLRNERATDRRVRLGNRLDGPTLPPWREGVPETGWDRDGATTVVPAGETVALGYACPAPASTPPVAVEDVGAAEDTDETVDPADAVRELGDHRPPRDVLERGEEESTEQSDEEPTTNSVDDCEREPPAAAPSPDSLAERRDRIETAEALDAAGVAEAAALLETTGGVDGVNALAARLDEDARELRALAAAAEALADRAAAASPPLGALRRLS